ncbi:MAG: hypothetical protein ACK5LO_08985 [Leucobacter sp.]
MTFLELLFYVLVTVLLSGFCAVLIMWVFSVSIEAIRDWVSTRRKQQRAREEAELDRTARELQETIQRLAELIAEERLAAERTSRDMDYFATDSTRD